MNSRRDRSKQWSRRCMLSREDIASIRGRMEPPEGRATGRLEPIPDFTTVLAKINFPRGSWAIELRNALGPIYQDPSFSHLFPACRNPVEAPWRLAIITILQVLETLSDWQAIERVGTRVDWKYALSLSAEEQYMHPMALVHFRERLLEPEVQKQVLNPLIRVCRRQEWLQEMDSINSNAILETIQRINILEGMIRILGEALSTIDSINENASMTEKIGLDLIVKFVHFDWFNRYVYGARLQRIPKKKHEQLALLEQIGRDTKTLLETISADESPDFINELPEIRALQRAWEAHYG